jgi:hypothetical protein
VSGGTFLGGVGAKEEDKSESVFSASKTGQNVEISVNFKEFVFFKKEKRSVFSEKRV